MKGLEQLRARLKEIDARCNAIVDEADADSGLMTEEQQTEFDNLTSEHTKIIAEIDRREKLETLKTEQTKSVGRQVDPAPVSSPRIEPVEKDEMSGFEDIGEFAMCVKNAFDPSIGMIDDRLKILGAPTNFHKETGASEGFMVPAALRRQIWELVFAEDDLLSMVDSEPTSGNQVQMLADETTPWGATGVTANWLSEGNQMTASKLETEGRDVKLHKLYAYVLATEELLEDAPRLNNRLTRKASQALRWKISDTIIYGNGVGKPLGYFNSGALVSVAKEGSQAADTIQTENIAKMYSRMLPSGLGRAVWLGNSDILTEVMTMTISNQPVWTPPGVGMRQAPGGSLMGRPLILSEHAKTLGDKGDIQFIDPMGYYMAVKRGGIKFTSSIHLYFDYDIQAFKWTFRLGGQPYLEAPVSPANGTNTKSHFVTLDERA